MSNPSWENLKSLLEVDTLQSSLSRLRPRLTMLEDGLRGRGPSSASESSRLRGGGESGGFSYLEKNIYDVIHECDD